MDAPPPQPMAWRSAFALAFISAIATFISGLIGQKCLAAEEQDYVIKTNMMGCIFIFLILPSLLRHSDQQRWAALNNPDACLRAKAFATASIDSIAVTVSAGVIGEVARHVADQLTIDSIVRIAAINTIGAFIFCPLLALVLSTTGRDNDQAPLPGPQP